MYTVTRSLNRFTITYNLNGIKMFRIENLEFEFAEAYIRKNTGQELKDLMLASDGPLIVRNANVGL